MIAIRFSLLASLLFIAFYHAVLILCFPLILGRSVRFHRAPFSCVVFIFISFAFLSCHVPFVVFLLTLFLLSSVFCLRCNRVLRFSLMFIPPAFPFLPFLPPCSFSSPYSLCSLFLLSSLLLPSIHDCFCYLLSFLSTVCSDSGVYQADQDHIPLWDYHWTISPPGFALVGDLCTYADSLVTNQCKPTIPFIRWKREKVCTYGVWNAGKLRWRNDTSPKMVFGY